MLTSEDSNVPSLVAEKGFDQMKPALIGSKFICEGGFSAASLPNPPDHRKTLAIYVDRIADFDVNGWGMCCSEVPLFLCFRRYEAPSWDSEGEIRMQFLALSKDGQSLNEVNACIRRISKIISKEQGSCLQVDTLSLTLGQTEKVLRLEFDVDEARFRFARFPGEVTEDNDLQFCEERYISHTLFMRSS